MAQIGVVKSEEEFWKILFEKWQQYLHKLTSGQHLTEVLGKKLESIDDLKDNFETFKIYMRGHNLYDIFYGRYKKNENEILKKYLKIAPREDFRDILDGIERFTFFESRKED